MRPAARSRSTSRSPTSAVMADGLTGSPCSSMTKQRSASPSNASPRSASCSTTAACRSRRFSGSSGLASWLGNVPSSSKYSGTTSSGSAGQTGAGAEHGRRREAAHAVAGVDDDLERPDARQVDQRAQERRVLGEHVAVLDRAALGVVDLGHRTGGEVVAREVAHRRQAGVLADGPGARAAQLDAVVLRRVVARGEHGAGDAERAGGEVEAVGRRQADRGSRRRRAPARPSANAATSSGPDGRMSLAMTTWGRSGRPRGARRRRRTPRRSRGRRCGLSSSGTTPRTS